MSAPRSLLAARTALRTSAPVSVSASVAAPALAGSSRSASTYAPRSYNPPSALDARNKRPPRPRESTFFTAKAELTATLLSLHAIRSACEERLRAELVWPIPKGMPHLEAPPTAWKSRDGLGMLLRTNRDFDNLISLLNKLHHMRFVAETAGVHDVAARIDEAIAPYQRPDRVADIAARAARMASRQEGFGIDELGRAYAIGRRKASSARVWVVPSQAARAVEAAAASEAKSTEGEAAAEGKDGAAPKQAKEAAPTPMPQSDILINHLALPLHFPKVADRETVLRPLRVTGLLGAYNVFAIVRGGGTTGQSGAVAHALAQALTVLRPDTHDALFNDGALKRDVRVVERKKTNRPKARKGVSAEETGWLRAALTAVHLGQALRRLRWRLAWRCLVSDLHSSMHIALDGGWGGAGGAVCSDQHRQGHSL